MTVKSRDAGFVGGLTLGLFAGMILGGILTIAALWPFTGIVT
jgi:hypothetical protein